MVLRSLLLLLVFSVNGWAQSEESDETIISVLSFNILGGRTTNNSFDLDVLANLIKKADPDFVAMQEVDFKVNRSKKLDLVTELGYRTGMTSIFARAMYYDGGEYGEGMLSKYSYLSSRNISLPCLPGQEPRAAIEITVELSSGDTITMVGTHFAHEGEEGRILQAQRLKEEISNNKYPTILAGDLNAQPGSKPIEILETDFFSTYDLLKPEPSFPSEKPRIKIDYVMYYPKRAWTLVSKEMICDTLASDHCAYLVKLKLL